MSLKGDLAPLQSILDEILNRIKAVEDKVKVQGPAPTSEGKNDFTLDSPAVIAYDKHIQSSLEPFLSVLHSLPEVNKSDVETNLQKAWYGVRDIIVAASKCKKPSSQKEMAPLLKQTQESILNIQKTRLPRDYDNHVKAINEMLACLGWVMIDHTSQPPSPTLFVKGCIGSSDFWANKIRKTYKGKTDNVAKLNIEFCDSLKTLISDLAAYTKEYHTSGLAWNFANGIELSKYDKSTSDNTTTTTVSASTTTSKQPSKAAGIADIKAELAKKRSSQGDSAATGLKKVTKDQQTWRKEYKNSQSSSTSKSSIISNISSKINLSKSKQSNANKATPSPVFEYRERGSKWVIEYQTKETVASNENGVMSVDIQNPKQHVYIYKCDNVTFDIKGKANSIIVDNCTKCNIIFESVISSCEIVNCKKIQTQVKGVCASITVDKTDGFLTYLSKESIPVTTFVTCKSSEMNVNYPNDNDELIEIPIPEQFHHKFNGGVLQSSVSELYH